MPQQDDGAAGVLGEFRHPGENLTNVLVVMRISSCRQKSHQDVNDEKLRAGAGDQAAQLCDVAQRGQPQPILGVISERHPFHGMHFFGVAPGGVESRPDGVGQPVFRTHQDHVAAPGPAQPAA
jgi:hypothetical protein